jgi:hypothetical protein
METKLLVAGLRICYVVQSKIFTQQGDGLDEIHQDAGRRQ